MNPSIQPETTGPTHGRMAVRNPFLDIHRLVPKDNPVIIDAGACYGKTISQFLKLYKLPMIYAFEPMPEYAAQLRSRCPANRVRIIEKALGAENQMIPFHIIHHQPSSSVMPPGDWLKYYHDEKMDIDQTIEVEMVKLADILPDISIDIFKLDIQGNELKALQGTDYLLKEIQLIFTEIEFIPLYQNQPLFSDVEQFLRSFGFRLYNLYELWTHPDGQLTAGDALFLNNRFFKKGFL